MSALAEFEPDAQPDYFDDDSDEPDYVTAERHAAFAARARNGDASAVVVSIGTRRALATERIGIVAARVESAPAPRYLARPVWAEDAYGVIAAENKAGKTWVALDFAVAVAAGGKWLGAFPVERSGPVLSYWGEASDRKTVRRVQAIGAFYGVDVVDLPLYVTSRVPHLASLLDLADIEADLDRVRPVAVIVDPLYLAARGVKGSDLFGGVGAVLEPLQHLCQDAGAALVVVHHWNQSGKGRGRERMSGAGSAEWGRVLVSLAVESRRTHANMLSAVVLAGEFMGDEMPDTQLRIERRVWAENPDDISSKLHYEIERLGDASAPDENRILPDEKPSVGRVLAVLIASEEPLDVIQIGDRIAVDGGPMALKKRTIQDCLKRLAELGRARQNGSKSTGAALWQLATSNEAHAEPEPEQQKCF